LRIKEGGTKKEEMSEEKLKSEPRLIVWINRRKTQLRGEGRKEGKVVTRE
jgi:hypothetical protein